MIKSTIKFCSITIISLIVGMMIVSGNTASAAEKKLGTMRVSAYSPACNTPAGSRATSTGATARGNHTIAVDMHDPICGYGRKLRIGDTVYTVEDCGNLHKYGRDLDIFMETSDEADEWGVRDVEVYIITEDKPEKKKAKPTSTPRSKPTKTPSPTFTPLNPFEVLYRRCNMVYGSTIPNSFWEAIMAFGQ